MMCVGDATHNKQKVQQSAKKQRVVVAVGPSKAARWHTQDNSSREHAHRPWGARESQSPAPIHQTQNGAALGTAGASVHSACARPAAAAAAALATAGPAAPAPGPRARAPAARAQCPDAASAERMLHPLAPRGHLRAPRPAARPRQAPAAAHTAPAAPRPRPAAPQTLTLVHARVPAGKVPGGGRRTEQAFGRRVPDPGAALCPDVQTELRSCGPVSRIRAPDRGQTPKSIESYAAIIFPWRWVRMCPAGGGPAERVPG